MTIDMQGKPISDNSLKKVITIQVDDRLEDDRFIDFVENYLIPFMEQLQVPVADLNYF